jgi:hypothetical protein
MSRLVGPLRQIGLVVADMQLALEHWTQLMGVGPFILVNDVTFDDYRYMGKAMPGPTVSIAFAQSGDLQIEIIKQHDDVPSGYLDFIKRGAEGMQHLCAWPDSREEFESRRAALVREGFTIVHEGHARGSDIRFTYFSLGASDSAPLLELSEGNLLPLRPIWEKLKLIARDWDGTDPVRSFEAMAAAVTFD